MRVLLLDILRRHKPLQLMAVAAILGFWYAAGGEEDPEAVPVALATSMWAAYLIGPGRHMMMIPPAVPYLPLSRRDVWRATWLASTLWPTALVAVTTLLTMLAPATRATMGFSRIPLAAMYAFVYAGAGCALLLFLSVAVSHPRTWRPFRAAIPALIPIVTMAGFYAVIWGGRYIFLPTQWSEFSLAGALRLVATIGLVTAVYFYSPPVTGAPPLRAGNRRGVAARAAVSPVPPSRLTGLPRLLWNEYAWTMAITAAVVVGLAVTGVVVDTFYNTQGLAAGVARNQLVQLFDQNGAGPEFGLGYMFWLILFVLATVARFGFMMRHLRVLPIRPLQLNAIFVAWPAAVLVTFWGALLAAYVLVVGQPVTSLSLGILILLIGLGALTRSLGLRWQHGWEAVIVLAMISGVLSAVPMPRPGDAELLLGGVACLIAAALLNRATLKHSAAYKRPTMALGLAPPR